MRRTLALLLTVAAPVATAESDDTVARCLSCHMTEAGQIDIVGLTAMEALPPEWPFLFEDGFDMDGDGIAGVLRFVSGADGPRLGLYGSSLSAGRFEDFAQIAADAHGIPIDGPAEMQRVSAAFRALSPDPVALPQMIQRLRRSRSEAVPLAT